MIELKKIEDRCIEHMRIDYMPLQDVIREFSGFENEPTDEVFLNGLKFIEYLIDKYKIKSLEEPTMKEIEKPTKDLIDWIKLKWYSREYDEINYGIWFVLE